MEADLAVGPARHVAGAPGESVTQPRWSPDGVLHYVSDRTGWGNIYADPDRPVCPMAAEFGEPDWAFGNSTYGFAPGVLLNMMDDPLHHRIRRLVTPSVAPRALAVMEAELRQRHARQTRFHRRGVRRAMINFLRRVVLEQ